jgi:alpha-beta hydrolase superfamily lysophospholipase
MRPAYSPHRARIARTAIFVSCLAAPVAGALAQAPAPPHKQEVRADDGHRLVLWVKRPPSTPRGEIVLLHGRTWSALPNFDLHAKGEPLSLMDALVAKGYAVYALDQRGYGATSRDATGWLTPARAAADAEAVADWVAARAPRSRRPALLGYSRGSATVMLSAQRHPEKISSLIMYAPYHNVVSPPEIPEEPRVPPRARTTAEGAAEDFITPDSTPAGVKEAYVKSATTLDPVRADWRHEEQFNALDPAAVKVPTLVIHGDRDPYAASAGLPVFFSRLGTVDRWWVVLANADHVAHLERQGAFVSALVGFLERSR